MALPRKSELQPLNVGVVPALSLPAAPGDEQLFAELYPVAASLGTAHGMRFVSRSEAKEIAADALGEVWDRWSQLTVEQRTLAYCLATIHYHILSRVEENRRLVSLEDAEVELTHLAIHEIDSANEPKIKARIMDVAIDEMPPRRRSVFLLLLDGLPYKEVCERLSMSIGTVNTHVRLARDDIRAAAVRSGYYELVAGRLVRLAAASPEENEEAADA